MGHLVTTWNLKTLFRAWVTLYDPEHLLLSSSILEHLHDGLFLIVVLADLIFPRICHLLLRNRTLDDYLEPKDLIWDPGHFILHPNTYF